MMVLPCTNGYRIDTFSIKVLCSKDIVRWSQAS